ncbi:hypothetical protein VitviT2T_005171 [Vitis vinifera]|uniref:ALG11 mannosyltransferase N-terminal domain-containing protein n=1 Tax=Vitis vinifera TaxID=29760 RepID=A0ABY9BS08_VITVI|nr:hypothetical protein VitviT2T_005171 [Vitis vinifera]
MVPNFGCKSLNFKFFHPYTIDGGDDERVLWHAIKAIQKESSDLDYIIYTNDHDASSNSLMAHVVQRFGGVFGEEDATKEPSS